MPKVSVFQWGLTFLSLTIATAAYLFTTYEALAIIVAALVLVNLAILVEVSFETERHRLPGKFVLVASTIFYFWIGALVASRQEAPFAISEGVPIPSRQFNLEDIQLALLYITLFQAALFVGYALQPKLPRVIDFANTRLDSSSQNARLLRYLLAACAVVPLLISYDLNIGNTIGALLAARGETSIEARDIGLLHFLLFFGMFGAALFLVEAVALRTMGKIRNFVIGAVTVLPFILSGTRHIWLYISLPAGILILRRFKGRLTLMRMARWGVVIAVFVLVMQLQFAFRTYGWGSSESSYSNVFKDYEVTGQFTALLFAEYLVPGTHEYFKEPAETYFLIHWMPREFWPGKPIMKSWSYYNDAYVRGGAFNVTPSVIGQFHINWGIYGVIWIGIWLGLLTSVADRLLLAVKVEEQRAMTVVIGMFYGFIISSFRFYSPIYFAYLLFAIVAMWFITRRNFAVRFVGKADSPIREAVIPTFAEGHF